MKQQLSVSGTYTDGTTEDLTRKVQYSANDESVVDVTPNGELSGRRPGETAIMVRTLGKAVAARIAVIEKPLKDYPAVPRNNFIDELIFAKLKRVHIVPSPLSSDSEFLRRVYLDTVGLLPTLDESERFLQSKDPQKASQTHRRTGRSARVRRGLGDSLQRSVPRRPLRPAGQRRPADV